MKKYLVISILLAFVFITSIGLNLSMQADKEGNMSDCAFMTGQTSICQMPVSEHFARWQRTFTATWQFTYLFFFLTASIFIFKFLHYQFTLGPPGVLAFFRYKIDHPDTKVYNYLLQALSDGIIQPKISL